MGGEIAQFSEWNYEQSLDWHVLENAQHRGIQKLVKSLNQIYKDESALHKYDNNPKGFEWIDERDYQANVISFIRKADKKEDDLIIICNFSDHTRKDYPLGVPNKGTYEEIFNSQDLQYDGWNSLNGTPIKSKQVKHHGRNHKLELTLPALSVIYLKQVK